MDSPASNELPRMVCEIMGIGQVRRFKILSSVGAAIPSDVGFPEGCALSVLCHGNHRSATRPVAYSD